MAITNGVGDVQLARDGGADAGCRRLFAHLVAVQIG